MAEADGQSAAAAALAHPEIAHLLHEYCRCLDSMDLDGLVSCFTEDCVVEHGPGASMHSEGADTHVRTLAGWRIAHRRLLMRGSEGDFPFSIDPLERMPPEPGWTPPSAADVGGGTAAGNRNAP